MNPTSPTPETEAVVLETSQPVVDESGSNLPPASEVPQAAPEAVVPIETPIETSPSSDPNNATAVESPADPPTVSETPEQAAGPPTEAAPESNVPKSAGNTAPVDAARETSSEQTSTSSKEEELQLVIADLKKQLSEKSEVRIFVVPTFLTF